MNDRKKEEILWINTLKGGCILLVVLYHVVLPGYLDTVKYLTAGMLPAHFWVSFNTVLSPLRMPAFFFVSGLLAANSLTNKTWKAVFTSRVTNFFYLYILWGGIQWLSIITISSEITGHQISENINSSYADSPQQFITLMLMGMSSAWYLYALGLFFVLGKLFNSHRLPLLLIALVLNYAAIDKIIPGWGPASLSQYFIFFLVGSFFNAEMIRLSEWHRSNIVPWSLLLMFAVVHVFLGLNKSIFLCILAIALTIAITRALNHYFKMSPLNWLGKNTLQIYVLHRIFIEYFGMTAILFARKHQLFNNQLFSLVWATVFPIAMVALCVGCSLGVWKILNNGMGKCLFIYPKLLYARSLR